MTFSVFSLLLAVAPAFAGSGTLQGPHTARLSVLHDTASPGLEIGQRTAIAPFAAVGSLDLDTLIVCDGLDIARVELPTGTRTTIATLPAFVYPSFVLIEPDLAHALVGESAFDDILRVDLATGAVSAVANIHWNYAAVWEDTSHLLVSAAVLGNGHPNHIVRLDLSSGATTLVALVPGPSGPLARAADGDLYYGHQPGLGLPPGSQSVLRWTRAQVESGVVLTDADAVVFASGLDGVASVAVDPVTEHVFVSNSRVPGPCEVLEYAPDQTLLGVVLQAPNWISNFELLSEPGSGSFQAFQPAGHRLRYVSTDFLSFAPAYCSTLRPRQSLAEVSGPGLGGPGDVALSITGAWPNASVFVVRAPSWMYTLPETAMPFEDFLLHTGLSIAHFQGGGVWLPTDGLGRASTTLAGHGGGATQYVLQALVATPRGTFVGGTTPAFY